MKMCLRSNLRQKYLKRGETLRLPIFHHLQFESHSRLFGTFCLAMVLKVSSILWGLIDLIFHFIKPPAILPKPFHVWDKLSTLTESKFSRLVTKLHYVCGFA